MDSSDTDSIEARLRKVEETVARLESAVAELTRGRASPDKPDTRAPQWSSATAASTTPIAAGQATRAAQPVARSRIRPAPSGPSLWSRLVARGPQFWISRIGIALVLLAVVFIFDYAIDKGWLTPPIRVGLGLVLGVSLTIVGLRVQRTERWFSQLMFGGASATWYITGFAAYQLLQIVSHPVAFVFMVLVTVFTFWMGIRENDPALGVLGAVGGFGTPFFLYTEQGTVPALIGYACLVLLGSIGMYLRRGWRSLLWTAVLGACCVLLIALTDVAAVFSSSLSQT